MYRPPTILALPALLLLAPLAGAGAGDDVHELRADQVRARLGLTDREPPPEGIDVEPLLRDHFVRAEAGGCELYLSAWSLDEGEGAERLVELARELLAGQRAWLEWVPPSKDDAKQVEKDLAALDKWYSRLRPRDLEKGLDGVTGGDLLELLGAKDDVREASARLTSYLASGGNLGSLEARTPVPIVLAPTRSEFLGWVGFAGWANPASRDVFHAAGVEDWTYFFLEDVRVYSLVQPSGASLDTEKNPTGTRQQILQLSMAALLDRSFRNRMPMTLVGGLAMNLVTEVHGQCDTRVDGDLRPRESQAWEMFVPGGLSEGGILPAMPATTRWREFHGANHFTSLLRRAQKDGEEDRRRAGGGDRYFRIFADDGVRDRVVEAPFLGNAAQRDPVPEDFTGDWLEFTRAYRSCFLNWLRTEAGGSSRKSAQAFANLCTRFAAAASPEDFSLAFAAVYGGEGLSSVTADGGPDEETLEGRFLRWLSRQR